MEKSDLACTYAILMLADDDVDITADKMNTIFKAAKIRFVEPHLPDLFANALQGKSVADMLSSVGSAGSAPSAAPVAIPVAPSAGASAAPVKEEKKPVSEDESDESMGLDLFG